MHSATLQLRIEQHSFTIALPNTGQYLQIEALKMALTDGKYEQFANSGLLPQLRAADLADMTAYFSVLAPSILQELSFKTYAELPLVLANKVLAAYKEQFLPWFTPYHREILGLQPLPATPDAAAAPAGQ